MAVLEDRVRIALIPAYEPDENLIKLVDELMDNNFEVMVIDDGSGEEYFKIFDKLKAKVISYSPNIGKGHALKTGFKYIKDNYDDYTLVTMDSDGQHTVKDAIRLCEYVERNPLELVLGMRKRGENTPLKSYLGNAITRFVYRSVTREDIYDTQTGLRAFSPNLMDYMLNIEGERFEYEMNVLLNVHRYGIKVKEIVIETIYIDNNSKSHFKAFRDSFKIYKVILKFSMSSFASFLIDYFIYSLVLIFGGNVILANVLARVISSVSNYNINKRLVFKSKAKSAFKYFSLAFSILILNTFILWIISNFINAYVAKIITESILFILSFTIQKIFIFKEVNDS